MAEEVPVDFTTPIERAPVKSSQVKSIGYHPGTGLLEVEFHNGGVYRYEGVPADVHQKLIEAESVGRALGQHVKGTYRYAKAPKPADPVAQ